MTTAMALPQDHPMMKAWNEFCAMDEFKSALCWAVETKYDDGRPVGDIQREQHAKGAMWLAFTKGMERSAERQLDAAPAPSCEKCGAPMELICSQGVHA